MKIRELVVYTDRCEAVFARARELVRVDPAAFAKDGRRLAEIFHADLSHPRGVSFVSVGPPPPLGLFTRISLAAEAASLLFNRVVEDAECFDEDADLTEEDILSVARMTVLAFLLGADPKASEVVTPDICELGVLQWDTELGGEFGRDMVDWHESDWPHGNVPSSRALRRLLKAVARLEPEEEEAVPDVVLAGPAEDDNGPTVPGFTSEPMNRSLEGADRTAQRASSKAAGPVESDTHEDETPRVSNLPKLRTHDRQAWQLSILHGMTQAKVAEMLNNEHGTTFTQGQVSRMIARAKAHAEASGLAEKFSGPAVRPRTIDPAKLELGKRKDGRKPRPSDLANRAY